MMIAKSEHERRLYELLIERGVRFVCSFSFDQVHAGETSPPGGCGRLGNEDGQQNPVVDILDLGPYT